ncbi:MAG: hypothetical protein JNL79_07515 [Myxococcales bacterium]|nr:hypothetical protein [Myxococcales bacterium]
MKELPALMVYESEAALVGRFSDERDFLRMLLTSIRSRPGLLPRYAKHAALAFARKNVFAKAHTPPGSVLVPDQISCDGCPPSSALSVIQRTMSVDLPLRVSADDPSPQIQVFAPTGDAYERQLPGVGSQNFVTLEFSTSPSFASLLTSQQIPLRSTSDTNNAPPGFTLRALTVANWAAIRGAGVVYYRARQCLAGGSECIVTSVVGRPNEAQFIEISPGSGGCGAGNCAIGGRPSGKTQPLLTLALGLAVFVVRSRRRAS